MIDHLPPPKTAGVLRQSKRVYHAPVLSIADMAKELGVTGHSLTAQLRNRGLLPQPQCLRFNSSYAKDRQALYTATELRAAVAKLQELLNAEHNKA